MKNNVTGISSRPTNISSYLTSEGKEITKNINEPINKNHFINKIILNKIFLMKKKILLNLTTELNEKYTQEYESKFLNYELGNSEEISSTINYYSGNSIKNNENIRYEYERPLEDIEKIANEIYKSNKKNKKIYFIKKRK